jgi:hypothetical protein
VDDDDPSQLDEIEISPINPRARRVPGGIWNEDELPVLPWEAPEHRVVIPEDLGRLLGVEVAVLRWARSKYQRVLERHSQPIEVRVLHMPSAHIAGWLLAGPGPGKADKWRVFFQIEQRWCVAVIGRDRNGSYNVITMHSPSDRNYLPNMMAKGKYSAREKMGEG